MTINTYLSTIESKIHKHAEQKQTHRYGKHFDGCQMWEGWEGLEGFGEKGEGIN